MIADIHLVNFRSYEDASFEFSPNVNIIVGPNASGKTNLLEALLVTAIGSSYRASDKELIAFHEEFLRLEAHGENTQRTIKIQRIHETTTKQYEINGKIYKRLDITKTLPVVLFEPNQLLQLIGSPEARRNFIDDILEQTTVGFSLLRSQYRRALQQRNALLKKPRNEIDAQLFAWNVRLSALGGQIAKHRLTLIDSINKTITDIYQNISATKERAKLTYLTTCDVSQYETSLIHKLENSIDKDHIRGFTGHGIHRDDTLIELNDVAIQHVASRGETRSLLLALKVISAQELEQYRQTKPIFLLDDVFSELDGRRRHALTNYLKTYQTFITTTEADLVVQHFMGEAKILPIGS